MAFGHRLLRWVLGAVLPIGDHLVFSFGLGLFAFSALVFLGGLLGLFGTAFFVALPSLLLALGAPSFVRHLLRARRLARTARLLRPSRVPAWGWLLLGFGVLGIVLIHVPTLVPRNLHFDARWYHLGFAQEYALRHRIERFPEGLLVGAYPQLATYLYTWAFQPD